jgi:hypothetical protein
MPVLQLAALSKSPLIGLVQLTADSSVRDSSGSTAYRNAAKVFCERRLRHEAASERPADFPVRDETKERAVMDFLALKSVVRQFPREAAAYAEVIGS